MRIIYGEPERPIEEIICCECDGGAISINLIPKAHSKAVITIYSNPPLYHVSKQGLDDIIKGLTQARDYINRK